jgi:RNA polymerase sigma factor (sigma-70 family)
VAHSFNQNGSALMLLYLSKRADLVRFFTARTSSREEAEDIVQEIYLKVAARDAPELEHAGAYLYRLGTNVMLDRARSRRRAALRDDAYYQTVRVDARGDDAADTPDPEAAIDARRRLDRVMQAVEALPPQCRRVFTMHKIEGLSYAEIAEALGVSRSAVEKHMIAALKRLAEHRS